MDLDFSRRVVIVDASHIAYTHSRSKNQLYAQTPDGPVNTTVITGIVKNVHRWSAFGAYPTVVCFDRPCPARKNWLYSQLGEDVQYKGGRSPKNPAIVDSLNTTQELLEASGVGALALNGFEADDLIAAAVESAKLCYPDQYIDVITGDADMVPLVDDQVSVFLRSTKGTSYVHPGRRLERYAQITPESYADVLQARSAYKGLLVPYNTLALAKTLRGDPSDNIPALAKKLFPPRKYNALVMDMQEQGLKDIRYDQESFDRVFEFLESYVQDDILLGKLQDIFRAMWLNFDYPSRASLPAFQFSAYDAGALQQACRYFSINLPS